MPAASIPRRIWLDQPLVFGGLEDVVVLGEGAVQGEVVVMLAPRLGVRLLEQVQLKLRAQVRLVAEGAGTLDLALEDPARRLLDDLAVLGLQVAEQQDGLLEPGDRPEGGEVGNGHEVAVAGLPGGQAVARLRLHLDVTAQEVVARLHAVRGDLLQEEVGGEPLAHQPPVHVRNTGEDRVEGPSSTRLVRAPSVRRPLWSSVIFTSALVLSTESRRTLRRPGARRQTLTPRPLSARRGERRGSGLSRRGQAGRRDGWHASMTAVIDSRPGRAATTRTMAVSSPSARRRNAAAAPEAGPK